VTVLVISTVAAWGMVGVIWMVQLVHYPLLGRLSELEPIAAAVDHQRRITWVVGPLMAAEGVTALVLLARRPDSMSAASAWSAATLLGVALLSTVFVQVPLHTRLAEGHDDEVVRSLISTNWVRTAAWTARALLLAAVLASP
jgi:predicted cobalt transporter CbtA